jgi:hypothetical protein
VGLANAPPANPSQPTIDPTIHPFRHLENRFATTNDSPDLPFEMLF